VEETPVHVDDLAMADEDDIRLSGKIRFVKSVSVT
jgi:hypothetical protein